MAPADTSQTMALRDGRSLGFAQYGVPEGRVVFHFVRLPFAGLMSLESSQKSFSLLLRQLIVEQRNAPAPEPIQVVLRADGGSVYFFAASEPNFQPMVFAARIAE